MKKLKFFLCLTLAVAMCVMLGVVAFANDGGEPFSIDYSSIFSEDMFSPLLEGITSNVWILLSVGLGLFAIFLGIRVIRNIFLNFSGVLYAARFDQKQYGGSLREWLPFYLKPSTLFHDLLS